MSLTNYTPFPALAWETLDQHNRRYMSTLCRVKFKIDIANSIAQLRLDPEQGELFGSDVYYDDNDQELRYPSDYVAFKKNTDIIVNARSFSPNNQPSKRWKCSVEIVDMEDKPIITKTLQICGERFWRRGFIGWRLDEPKECPHVPIRYSYAYGGEIIDEEGTQILSYEDNIAGRGLLDKKHSQKVHIAPQIESIDDPIDEDKPYHRYLPQGFGAIDKVSNLRLAHAGRYDEDWLKEHHPRLPQDFNEAFNQSAHPDLIYQGYLPSNAKFRLINLTRDYANITFTLPDYSFVSRFTTGTASIEKLMNIDTVIIDVEDDEKRAVYVTWRNRYPIEEEIQKVEISLNQEEHHG